MVWYGMEWNGMVWYGMEWNSMYVWKVKCTTWLAMIIYDAICTSMAMHGFILKFHMKVHMAIAV